MNFELEGQRENLRRLQRNGKDGKREKMSNKK
jgi:hypothetical protein